MAMLTASLTVGSWYELTKLDNPEYVEFELTTASPVVMAIDVGTPTVSADAFICLAGLNRYTIPFGKKAFLKLVSGTCSVTYSQSDRKTIDHTKCAFVYSDGIAVDEVNTGNSIAVGFNDVPTDTLEYVGYLHTVAAGLGALLTINQSTLIMVLDKFKPGRTVQIKGVAATTSQFSTIVDYASLASGMTLTTASQTVTIGYDGFLFVDLTAIIQELVNLSGWSTTSPIQLHFSDPGSIVTGVDATHVLSVNTNRSYLEVY